MWFFPQYKSRIVKLGCILIRLPYSLPIKQVIDSVWGMKTSNSIWRPFPVFQKTFRKRNLNALIRLIQKAIPEKTKLAKQYGLKYFKGKKKKNLKYQFDSFTRRIVAGVSSVLVVWINSIIVYQIKYCCSFVSSSEISTKTIRIFALNFYHQSIKWLGLRARHSIMQ